MLPSFAVVPPALFAAILGFGLPAEGSATTFDSVGCRFPAGAERVAASLCAAVASGLGSMAPTVVVELISLRASAIEARLGLVTDGRLRWGAPVTLDVIDRDSLPPGAVERLAGALLKQAAIARPEILPPSSRP